MLSKFDSFVILSCTVKYNIRTLSVKIKIKEIIEGDNTIVAPLVKQNIGFQGDNTITTPLLRQIGRCWEDNSVVYRSKLCHWAYQ